MKTYTFTLKGLNIKELHLKFSLIPPVVENQKNTDVTELTKDTTIAFSDESKRLHKCITSSSSNSVCCFWDRHPFTTEVHSCPLRIVPKLVEKTYYSEMSKDKNTLKERVLTSSGNILECDGTFCSLNCLKAFILDNKHNKQFDESEYLLSLLTNGADINTAPHWRLLSVYGGNMSIDEFRTCFNRVEYNYHGVYKLNHICHLFEEKIKF